MSRIPAVSPLGVLCKTGLNTLFTTFFLRDIVPGTAQRTLAPLRCAGCKMSVKLTWRREVFVAPSRTPGPPGAGAASLIRLETSSGSRSLTNETAERPPWRGVRHATAADLERISDLLAQPRMVDGLVERTPGVFYRRSGAFPTVWALPAFPRGLGGPVRRRAALRRRHRSAQGHLDPRAGASLETGRPGGGRGGSSSRAPRRGPVGLVRLVSEHPERSTAEQCARVPAHASFRAPSSRRTRWPTRRQAPGGPRRGVPWPLFSGFCGRHRLCPGRHGRTPSMPRCRGERDPPPPAQRPIMFIMLSYASSRDCVPEGISAVALPRRRWCVGHHAAAGRQERGSSDGPARRSASSTLDR
jgi:hypothetical protein